MVACIRRERLQYTQRELGFVVQRGDKDRGGWRGGAAHRAILSVHSFIGSFVQSTSNGSSSVFSSFCLQLQCVSPCTGDVGKEYRTLAICQRGKAGAGLFTVPLLPLCCSPNSVTEICCTTCCGFVVQQ